MLSVMESAKVCEAESMDSRPSILQGLKRRQVNTQKELNSINEAIAALEGNPEVTKLLEVVAKVARL